MLLLLVLVEAVPPSALVELEVLSAAASHVELKAASSAPASEELVEDVVCVELRASAALLLLLL